MTIKEFKKKIDISSWYERYLYYLIAIFFTFFGVKIFYGISTHLDIYKKHGTVTIAVCSACMLFVVGCISLFYFIPVRYRIQIIKTNLSDLDKRNSILQVLHSYNVNIPNPPDNCWEFKYDMAKGEFQYVRSRKRFSVFITYDNNQILVSAFRIIFGVPIDFNDAKKFKKDLILRMNAALQINYSKTDHR